MLALQPSLIEEIWARLFLITALVALFYPLSRDKPGRAIWAAVLLAVVIHVLAHVPQSIGDLGSAIFVVVLYGLPLALLFVTRDLAHAVGYHFLIDFIRFIEFPPF